MVYWVSDYDIELLLMIAEKLNGIVSDVKLDLLALESFGHVGQVELGHADDLLQVLWRSNSEYILLNEAGSRSEPRLSRIDWPRQLEDAWRPLSPRRRRRRR